MDNGPPLSESIGLPDGDSDELNNTTNLFGLTQPEDLKDDKKKSRQPKMNMTMDTPSVLNKDKPTAKLISPLQHKPKKLPKLMLNQASSGAIIEADTRSTITGDDKVTRATKKEKEYEDPTFQPKLGTKYLNIYKPKGVSVRKQSVQ